MGCGSSSNVSNARDLDSNATSVKPTSDAENVPNGNSTNDQFVQDAVKSHNELRAKHSAGPLIASGELNKYSQKYADKLAKLGVMKHSDCKLQSGESVGENLYCYWSSDSTVIPTAYDAVESWYSEIKDYDFNKGEFSMATGHFTQVVWKATRELGIAWAKSTKGTTYVVANYKPAGNVIGDFDRNVTQT